MSLPDDERIVSQIPSSLEVHQTSHDGMLAQWARRNWTHLEDKLIQQVDEIVLPLEAKMRTLESKQPPLDFKISEVSASLKGLQQEFATQVSRSDAIDGRVMQLRQHFQDELCGKQRELALEIATVHQELCHLAQQVIEIHSISDSQVFKGQAVMVTQSDLTDLAESLREEFQQCLLSSFSPNESASYVTRKEMQDISNLLRGEATLLAEKAAQTSGVSVRKELADMVESLRREWQSSSVSSGDALHRQFGKVRDTREHELTFLSERVKRGEQNMGEVQHAIQALREDMAAYRYSDTVAIDNISRSEVVSMLQQGSPPSKQADSFMSQDEVSVLVKSLREDLSTYVGQLLQQHVNHKEAGSSLSMEHVAQRIAQNECMAARRDVANMAESLRRELNSTAEASRAVLQNSVAHSFEDHRRELGSLKEQTRRSERSVCELRKDFQLLHDEVSCLQDKLACRDAEDTLHDSLRADQHVVDRSSCRSSTHFEARIGSSVSSKSAPRLSHQNSVSSLASSTLYAGPTNSQSAPFDRHHANHTAHASLSNARNDLWSSAGTVSTSQGGGQSPPTKLHSKCLTDECATSVATSYCGSVTHDFARVEDCSELRGRACTHNTSREVGYRGDADVDCGFASARAVDRHLVDDGGSVRAGV